MNKKAKSNENERSISRNKRAFHNYFIEDKFEAGICLRGTEVKSIRNGKINITEAFGKIINGELFLFNCHISPYSHGNQLNHDPLRDKKLLIHKKEINRLIGKIKQQGYSLLPLGVYIKRGLIKVEMGLGKGKKLHDKRDTLKAKEAKRDMDRAMKSNSRDYP